MFIRKWWRAPVLWRSEDQDVDRRANSLELFFDLVFVVLVAELAHSLGGNPSWEGVGAFVLLFIPAWWVWIGHTYYTERFEANDLSYRLITFLMMLGVASMAFHVHYGVGETAVGFALSYIFCRLLITFWWWWGGHHNPDARPMTTRFVTGFVIGIGIWTASLFVDAPLRYVLWGVGLLVELITPIMTRQHQAKLPRLSTTHLPERYGIFTILVLREPIAGVIEGIGEVTTNLTLTYAIDGVLGMLLAFLLWWIYFDQVSERRLRQAPWVGFVWSYMHLPLVVGVGAIGAGLLNAFHDPLHGLEAPIRWLIAGGVGATLLSIAVLEMTEADETRRQRRMQEGALIVAVIGTVLLAAFGGDIRPLVFFAVLLALVALPVIVQLIYSTPEDLEHEHD